MNNKSLKLSVCIPTYNGATYIRECIDSILNQSFGDFELIISDDSSKDDTLKIIESFDDPRIKIFHNDHQLGLVGNWNRCIELAKGEYIMIFHQDDVMGNDNLLGKVNVLNNNLNAGLVYSDVCRIDGESQIIDNGWFFKTESSEDFCKSGKKFFEELFSGFNIVCCPGVMVRKKCYEKLSNFDKRLPFSADWEMWLRISLFYDIAYLKKPLINYRVHNDNETNRFKGLSELEQYFSCKYIALTKFPNRVPNQQKLKSELIEEYEKKAIQWSYHYYQKGDHQLARKSLNFAVTIRAKGLVKKSMSNTYQHWFSNQMEDITNDTGSFSTIEPIIDQSSTLSFKKLLSMLWTKSIRKMNSLYRKKLKDAKQA